MVIPQMKIAYEQIRSENEKRYGTDIGRIGPLLLANRYDDQTHFIFELLQNAEDAIRRRGPTWNGPRRVTFRLTPSALELSHYGLPFNEDDVRGICGIAESTKSNDLTAIGRFGIGFKSVYSYTNLPQVHSGENHFEIENFVWPREVQAIPLDEQETRFVFPLREDRPGAFRDLAKALRSLGCRSLLFLTQIEEVAWDVAGGNSGRYLRERRHDVLSGFHSVSVRGQSQENGEIESETFILFRRKVFSGAEEAGSVEVAFQIVDAADSRQPKVQAATDCNLVVFFPTVVPTNTGFLIQGPFRTTPSRDNVPRDDEWNKHLVAETAELLVAAMRTLRDVGALDAAVLRTLPLEATKFSPDKLLRPLFDRTKEAFLAEELIPASGGGCATARNIRLARSQDLRELLSPDQLTDFFASKSTLRWVTEEITLDRAPELRRYFIEELSIDEVRPEELAFKLRGDFLVRQDDEWIVRLYSFLAGQQALLRQARILEMPWIRLEDGSHVRAADGSKRMAFLPGEEETGFPTVRRAVCVTPDALKFLQSLGVTAPDPVDDVIANILPLYRSGGGCDPDRYPSHIARMLKAYSTDSKKRQESLIRALRETPFVAAKKPSNDERCWKKPTEVYQPTERLKELLAGLSGVYILDESLDCLRADGVRDFLEGCGVARHLEPIEIGAKLPDTEVRRIRAEVGAQRATSTEPIVDYSLRGLDELLLQLQTSISRAEWRRRAELLWDSLVDLYVRRGRANFSATYRWYYYTAHSRSFDANFVGRLREEAWVPSSDGGLYKPREICFDETGWKENQFLSDLLKFSPPALRELAKEAGIDLDVLTLLKSIGATNVEQVKALLGIEASSALDTEELAGVQHSDATVREESANRSESSHRLVGELREPRSESNDGVAALKDIAASSAAKEPGGAAPFISYVAVSPRENEAEPGESNSAELLEAEELAIAFILEKEPNLVRAPKNQPGFDLYEPGSFGGPIRWIEVKAMTSSLEHRGVALSHTQFAVAMSHGERYWLYVVENVRTSAASIAKIQNPAGRARSFTFDRGWNSVAERI
jgi:hypothetical protein